MSTSVKALLDNAILQSVAESYLDLLGRLTLEAILDKGVNRNNNNRGQTPI